MKRLKLVLSIVAMLLSLLSVRAQDTPPPLQTLVPPTPLPPVADGASDALVSESAVARIQRDGILRAGILFNEPPFGELNIRGEVIGFDAALGRSIANAWGIEVEFIQVTRQTAQEMLLQGEVDVLIAAQVHRRELDTLLEFSETYYRGSQAMMVLLDDPAQSLAEMNNRRIGYVLGTASQDAINYWQQRNSFTISAQSYLTIDQAIVALVNGEIDGVVDKRYRLRNLVQPELTRVLEDTVQPEPYAIAMRRQDVHMRNLVNRTLQYLAQSGRLAEIHSEFFPSRPYPADTVPQWENIGDEAPNPSQYPTDVPYPQQYALPRVQSSGVLRVAGIPEETPEMSEADRRLTRASRFLAESIGERWGVNVEFVAGSVEDPVAFVERGDADIALGIRPNWDQVDRVDFAGTYLLRGKRLMVEQRDDFQSFRELRGKWVGVFASEPGTADQVNALASSVNATVNIFTIARDEDAAFEMLVENNIDVVFGDSIRLLPHIEANPDTLQFSSRCPSCDPWYTRVYLGVAVPRNDIDFRLLVSYTLQEMSQDGTLSSILQPVTVPGEALSIDVWPGPTEYLGFSLAN